MERTESRFSTLQAVLVVTSCIGAVKLVPPAGRPVPVTVPESCSTPFTTDVVKLLNWPVNAVPSGRVPVTGRSVVAGWAAAALWVCGAADALVAVPAIPKVAVMARATAPVVIRLEMVTLSPVLRLSHATWWSHAWRIHPTPLRAPRVVAPGVQGGVVNWPFTVVRP